MELKDRIYQVLVEKNFYGTTDAQTIVLRLEKELRHGNAKISQNKINDAINMLAVDGKITKSKNEISNNAQLVVGEFCSTRKGYGFVKVKGVKDDFFIADTKGAIEGDKVEIGFTTRNGKKEAFISKVVERKQKYVYGVVTKTPNGVLVFKPDDISIPLCAIPQDAKSKEAEGKRCNIQLMVFDDKTKMGYGTIDKIYGFANSRSAYVNSIADQYGFSTPRTEIEKRQIASIKQEWSAEDLNGWEDMTNLKIITSDPPGAKDKDDAMYAEKIGGLYRVYVPIAAVVATIPAGSPLDKTAYARGTSCYIASDVFPMFPPEVSNGICSLNENEIRKAFVLVADIDKNGEVVDRKFVKAFINVSKSFTYDEIEDVENAKNGREVEFEEHVENVHTLYELARILKNKNERNGSIDFAQKNNRYDFTEDKEHIKRIVDEKNVFSHDVVEQLALLYNQEVAKLLTENKINGLYRVHSVPKTEKVEEINKLLEELKIDYRLEATSKSYQGLTKLIKGEILENYISKRMIKSTPKAVYQPKNEGHFGLAFSDYAHSTSPIRRYPDLVIQRILDACLTYQKTHNEEDFIETSLRSMKQLYSFEQMEQEGEHLSEQERKAASADAKGESYCNALWATDRLGKVVTGKIIDISEGALVVDVENAELLVPLFDLPHIAKSEYKLSDNKLSLQDKASGRKFTIGDDVKLKIYKTDLQQGVAYASTDMEKEVETAFIDLNTKPTVYVERDKKVKHTSKPNHERTK